MFSSLNLTKDPTVAKINRWLFLVVPNAFHFATKKSISHSKLCVSILVNKYSLYFRQISLTSCFGLIQSPLSSAAPRRVNFHQLRKHQCFLAALLCYQVYNAVFLQRLGAPLGTHAPCCCHSGYVAVMLLWWLLHQLYC